MDMISLPLHPASASRRHAASLAARTVIAVAANAVDRSDGARYGPQRDEPIGAPHTHENERPLTKAVHLSDVESRGNAMKKGLRVLLIMQAMLAIVATADAQQITKSPKVGYLSPGSAGSPSPFITSFENGLRDLGWIN